MVILHTNMGDITLELDEEKAPVTVSNFIDYIKSGHYNNTLFHRVIDGFMIQGGGFISGMEQKNTKPAIRNEANNGLKNTAGTIAMARTMDPHSATAQFFINVSDNSFLDFTSETPNGWGYAVFGKITEGMDIVNKIKEVKTTFRAGHEDVPVNDIVIESVEIA
ncbi:Peptidyl-prolyl cis-trans isomerase B [invertebrate metagenome]|uniref:peptidylprolyl isomerase n=1 Tax=invertebrate metagenome TaxID=1711999 RepID=A0A2H9T5W6_9ZZZZ